MNGLTIKDGRLINNRPAGTTGLQEAARINKAMKRNEKASVIADGIEKAEMRKEIKSYMNKF